MSVTPEHLHYTKEHEWVSADGDIYTMGITDYAQAALGDIVYVQLPKIGESVNAGSTCGEVESTKSVSELFSPVTGVVTSINEALANNPELINSDPYSTGWLITIKVAASPKDLLTSLQYQEFTA
ncbi:MAG: glycine cleavage system protein GcvH [Actinomycetota bacterium]|nr:glycine cleavage system protein GcvH [Actinomycetota bacterium]